LGSPTVQCLVCIIYRATTNDKFSFRTDKEDDYYFVFNNPGVFSIGQRQITWSASYKYEPYVAYAVPAVIGLSIIGAVVIIAGLDIVGMWRAAKIAKTRKCPQCGQTVKLDRTVCPHCGFDITKSVRCKHCNALYERSLDKCPHCGAKKE
jgi:RNA polymerase subunit RPABC4/transcription elongation factor Spt4